ncbi:amidase [Ammoniphilus resinae]|uniref:Amidase n=1 Tax=Ammoniphilus resinae TaxID=861532 RepID=A0ABS4GL74_9BACL|nr:amidase [Ammoniphilus resinae]
MEQEICFATARDLAHAIQDRKLSAREVMEAHLSQVKRVNPQVNAIVSLDEEKAMQAAIQADERLMRGESVGAFHGLPIAIKDTHNAAGFLTTCGSKALRDNMATKDDLIVERLRGAGAIVIGKTNVPEFAAGSHTFNEVFGVTRNPYHPLRTAGGSSGGAAVAVTCGMIPFADGSDMGGSCRYPAAFNNVVGLRTSPGRVPTYPKAALYSPLSVQGPITRNVSDALFMMSVLAGPDARSPLSIEEPGKKFLEPLEADIKGLRVAYSVDLGGLIPVDAAVRKNFAEQIQIFNDLGCKVEEVCPDFSDADAIFQIWRAWEMEMTYSELFDQYQNLMKPSFVWNVQKGRVLNGVDIGRAERLRSQLYHRLREFFSQYDAFILPVSQVPPFDANFEYPTEINGNSLTTYIDWMRSCYYISATGNPALSVPSGFTEDGLPLGLQIVGPHRGDFEVLRIGYAFEQATGYGKQRPKLAL